MAPERMGRAELLVELPRLWKPGQHLSAIGPTGRGKSTLLGDLVPQLPQFDTVVILTPKGPDPAFLHLGHATASWPPRRGFGETFQILFNPAQDQHAEGTKVWRVTIRIREDADWAKLAQIYARVLKSIPPRKENHPNKLLVIVDESRFVCDPKIMNLGVATRNAIILGRSKNASVVNSFQAPRWVPREALDQITHALLWRNRDRDVAKRLAEISGAIDPKELLAAMSALDYHEVIWVDGFSDRWVVVDARR
jgi:hypothetical protein